MYKTKTTKNKNSTFIPLIPKIGVPLTSAEYISKENHVAGNLNFENKVKKIEEKIVKKKKVFLNLNNDLVSVIATKYEENRLEVTCESKTFFCYSVVWRRKTNKKHKTWEGDGFLSTDGQLAVLQNSEGKEIGRSTGKIFSKEFGDGAELIISGKEIEVTGKIERNSFESGSCFINVSNDLKPINSTKNFEKFKSLVQNEEIKLKNSEPRHNPHSEGAIIMRRPVVHEAVVDVVIDPILSTKLREHQIEGVKFLYECVMNMKNFSGQGAILADEMHGTWENFTINYFNLDAIKTITFSLILCPATLVKNWEKEFNKWLGTERIKVFCVDQNNSNIMEFNVGKIYPVLICTYEKMRSCMEIFKKANFDLIICDEGHRLKNAQIQTSIAIKNLQTKRRVILSGTPVQNDLTEFYSMCEFVNPGILGSLLTFKKVFEDPICKSRLKNCDADSKRLGSERMKELTRITKMFILRRTESINKNYLPPKTEIVLFIKQSEEQKNLYIQTIKNADKEIFDGTKINSAHVLELITLLKKVVNSTFCVKKKNEIDHYSLSNKELLKSSGKFNVLIALLATIKLKKEKVVLVSNYNLDLIEVLCKNEEFKVLRLDGKTLISKRQSLIEKFNKDDKTNNEEFIFLLSAKAGGVGINLIGANRLILFDIDWNPSVCKQGNIIITYYFNDEFPAIFEAMARIWRDGQKKEVFIYRFITTGTIEERIFQRQVTKLGLSDSIMDDKSTTDGFSTRDLKDLFSFDDETPCLTHDLLECKCLHEKNYRLQNIDVNNSLVDLFNWKHFIIDKKKNAAENIIDDEILNSILKSKKNPNLESIADLADKKLDVKQKKETIKKMESNEKKNLYSKSDLLININPEVATTNFFNIFLTENSTIENLKKNILTFDKNTAEHFFEKLADSNCSINDNLQNFTNDSSHKIDLDIDSSLENSDSNIESSCNEGDEVSSSSSTSSKSEVLIKESEFDNPILPIENNKNVLVVKHNDIKLKENKYEPVEKNFLYKLQEKKDSGIDLGSKEEICSNNSQQKNLIFSKTVLSKFVEKRKKKLKTIEENFDLKISILNIFQTKNLELKKKNKKLKKNYVNLSIGSAYKNSSNSSSSSSLISENENWFSIKRITSEEELILKKEEKFNLGLKYNFNFDCYLNHLTKLNPNAADFNLLSLNKTEFVLILNFLEIPRYFNSVFFEKIIKLRVLKNRIKKSVFNLNKIIEIDTFDDQSEKTVNFGEFLEFWDNLISGTSDFQHLIFNLLLNNEKNEKNCPFLEPSDFESTLYDLCDNNPGLAFLNGDKMIDFRKRYVETVILRTFFEKKNSQNKRMTLLEFKKSSFLPSIELLSNLKEDINLTRSIFSYKHYYVMYCRFWDLDLNHDMKINFQDFQYFNNSSLTRVMCNKIVKNFRSERGFRNRKVAFQDKSKIEAEVDDEFLTFGEFCFFLLCNEDKKKDTSIEFWFRCLDTDADGILSLYELKNFWEEQYERMLCINFPDPWLFDDFICVLIDLIKPNDPFKITILDLKKCKKNTELFLDMIFDIRKYEHHIKRNHPEFRDQDDIYICNSGSNIKIALDGWDKYAEKSYDEMMRVESRRRQTSNNSFSSNNSYNSSQEQNDYNLDNMEWSSNLYNGGWDDNEDHQHNSNEVVQDFTSTQA